MSGRGALLPKWPEDKGIVVLLCNISASTTPSNVWQADLGDRLGLTSLLSSFPTLEAIQRRESLSQCPVTPAKMLTPADPGDVN